MNFLRRLFELFITRNCIICGTVLIDSENDICEECFSHLPQTIFYENNPLEWRLKDRCNVHSAFAGYYYHKGRPIAKVVHTFKYKNTPQVAVSLGRELGKMAKLRNFDKDYDFLVPIPLHPKKKRIRGYNQSERICTGISEIIGLKIREDILRRVNNTSSQTQKSAKERWTAIQGDYELNVDADSLRGARIVLVDDIFTTGSTIEQCCVELQKIRDVRIGVITVAQASQ